MIFTTLMRVSYLRSRTHSEPAQGKPASPRGSFLPKMRVQFSKSPTISHTLCAKGSAMQIPRRRSGPDQFSTRPHKSPKDTNGNAKIFGEALKRCEPLIV